MGTLHLHLRSTSATAFKQTNIRFVSLKTNGLRATAVAAVAIFALTSACGKKKSSAAVESTPETGASVGGSVLSSSLQTTTVAVGVSGTLGSSLALDDTGSKVLGLNSDGSTASLFDPATSQIGKVTPTESGLLVLGKFEGSHESRVIFVPKDGSAPVYTPRGLFLGEYKKVLYFSEGTTYQVDAPHAIGHLTWAGAPSGQTFDSQHMKDNIILLGAPDAAACDLYEINTNKIHPIACGSFGFAPLSETKTLVLGGILDWDSGNVNSVYFGSYDFNSDLYVSVDGGIVALSDRCPVMDSKLAQTVGEDGGGYATINSQSLSVNQLCLLKADGSVSTLMGADPMLQKSTIKKAGSSFLIQHDLSTVVALNPVPGASLDDTTTTSATTFTTTDAPKFSVKPLVAGNITIFSIDTTTDGQVVFSAVDSSGNNVSSAQSLLTGEKKDFAVNGLKLTKIYPLK